MSASGKIAVIMGATAGGKTALALRLAADFNGEIISADSMQIYKGLDIGTAKPAPQQLKKIPHHLINLYDIERKLDVYRFAELAESAIEEIHSRGKLPFVVGGTGFYIHALLYGLDSLPGNAELRAGLDAEYDNPEGYEKLKILMRVKDPADFERWHMHRRKLIRALEVFTLTGKSITELQTLNKPQLRFPVVAWNLCWERAELKRRIAERTQAMLDAGWVKETEAVIGAGILKTPTAHQVLGYKIISEYLDGKTDFETMRARIVTNTWQLARRQITWFSNQHPEAESIPMPTAYEILKKKFEKEIRD
ncbi:MAG: tRNA (adenosine(37)-N6)-dimethylallyltransferase MiaA [Victivallaceae bacterium]|nr:tRNA (adenosine(37)-N6)-dimethylallyltransferase MiaA [Victivallaceae bacterium]